MRDGQTRIAQVVQRLDRMGEIEEADGVCAETKIEELEERKPRFDHPDLTSRWDKIQRKEYEAWITKINKFYLSKFLTTAVPFEELRKILARRPYC